MPKMNKLFEALPPQIRHLHFIGIGGVSMSALAEMAKLSGYDVSGSDNGGGERLDKLERLGIRICREHCAEALPNNDIATTAVIYTSAISAENPELSAATARGMRVFSRAEFLGQLMLSYKQRIGVAGTHGKSTTCAMLADIYALAGRSPTVICGAELAGSGNAFVLGESERLIFEACEYKDAFLSFSPTVAAVTNIEEEHLDYFRDINDIKRSFKKFISGASTAVLNIDDSNLRGFTASSDIFAHNSEKNTTSGDTRLITVSSYDRSADMYASEISFCGGFATFKVLWHGKPTCSIRLCVPGKHNVGNALIAAATALCDGVTPEIIGEALSSYRGIRRRMELRGKYKDAVIYDDYAHHPTEIKATLAAAREMGFRFISCAFQPHTYSRTALMFCELTKAFEDADEVLFADIYPAREQNVYGISSHDLACATRNGYYLPTPGLIAEHFKKIAAPGVLLLTMGAGRLDKVSDIILAPPT